jgi:hypothetical protein
MPEEIMETGSYDSQEAPIFDSYLDSDVDSTGSSNKDMNLTITSTLQGHFVYWKNSETNELVDNLRLVAYIPDLPYPQGRPLPPTEEERIEDTVLVDYSTTHETPLDRQVYVSIHGPNSDLGPNVANDANELPEQISGDELSVLSTTPHFHYLDPFHQGGKITPAQIFRCLPHHWELAGDF